MVTFGNISINFGLPKLFVLELGQTDRRTGAVCNGASQRVVQLIRKHNTLLCVCVRACVCVEEPIDVIGGSSGSDVSSDDSLDGADDPLVPYTSKMVLVDTL